MWYGWRRKNPRMRDEDILTWAFKEGRIIVTTDRDFEEMIWREGRAHCGVLRLENLPRTERIALLQDVLAHYSGDLKSGAIVIGLSDKIRIRRSPKRTQNRKQEPNSRGTRHE